MASFKAFLNSPVGPKTTHFWGPVTNWGFVLAVCFFYRASNVKSVQLFSKISANRFFRGCRSS